MAAQQTDHESVLDMGGYGVYIWSSYAVAFMILAWLLLNAYRQLRSAQNTLAALQEKDDA